MCTRDKNCFSRLASTPRDFIASRLSRVLQKVSTRGLVNAFAAASIRKTIFLLTQSSSASPDCPNLNTRSFPICLIPPSAGVATWTRRCERGQKRIRRARPSSFCNRGSRIFARANFGSPNVCYSRARDTIVQEIVPAVILSSSLNCVPINVTPQISHGPRQIARERRSNLPRGSINFLRRDFRFWSRSFLRNAVT